MKAEHLKLLTFVIDENRFAIPLEQVSRVIRAVAVTPVPDAHALFHGVMDYHGEVIVVLNLRERFGIENRPIRPADSFVVVSTPKRNFALVVDEVLEIREASSADLRKAALFSEGKRGNDPSTNPEQFVYFLRDEEGLFVICDVELLFSSELIIQIDQLVALQKKAKRQ